MQRRYLFLISLLVLAFSTNTLAQQSTPLKTYRVGIFAPLYLDSVFNDNGYRYGKNFPKFAVPGLDFVQGAQIALDSLPMLYGNIDARIFDSKSTSKPINGLIQNKELDSIDLIIGSVKDQEYFQLAGFAKQKNIPFISATYPNDGGITGNPFLVIVNSTLKAHCEAIYSQLLQNNSNDKIYLITRSGSQEKNIAENFKSINEPDGKPLVKIETINIDGDFSVIKSKLDSNKNSVFIGGSLNEAFAGELAAFAQSINKTYRSKLIGMPNWDGFKSISNNKKLKDYPVYYTTPYFNNKWDGFSKKIKEVYLKKYRGVPSDMTYKGYETVFLFSKMLTRNPTDFMSHLNEQPYKIFSEYRFKPVFNDKDSEVPDYFENKNLYLIKILNGSFSRAL
ncbi:MAG: amino acid ABC transporter substrate-binding protein [Chitinophagaceae bacterium]|nr:MAG: amino acid ABC transporter substrate-binding protein [Chitinophagaceae bacterium]